MGGWNCFICGEGIKGPHKIIYCTPTHYTKAQEAEMGGLVGKAINHLVGPDKRVDIKQEQGRGVRAWDRFIGVSPNTPRYTRWREVAPPKEKHWYDRFFGMQRIYQCHLHITCYLKCKHPDDKRPLEENLSYGFKRS
jgi:hypothetical protein